MLSKFKKIIIMGSYLNIEMDYIHQNNIISNLKNYKMIG